MLRRLYDRLPEGRRQFLKFCLVGGIGFVMDAGSYNLITYFFGLGPFASRLISAGGFGMTTTWLLNRSLTFRNQRGGPIWTEYLRFAAANGIGLSLNIGTHTLLVDNVGLFAAFPDLGIVAGTAVGLVFNFTGSKYFVFRRV
jgi:putative flippase GtrA